MRAPGAQAPGATRPPKWYLFWDALTENRTDGVLVRLTTVLRPGEDPARGDARLMAFAREVEGKLGAYVLN